MRFANPLLGLVTTVAFVGVVEGTVRLAWPHPPDGGSQAAWSVASATLGWERRPGFRGHISDIGEHPRAFDRQGYLTVDSAQVALPNRRRILVIGDSNAFGWGVATHDSFAEALDRLLPEFDVINLGVPGYSSYQSYITMQRALPVLSPAIVIKAGHFNDRRYVTPEDRPDGAERFEPIGTWPYFLNSQLRRLHFGRALHRLATRRADSAHIDELRPRVDAEAYRRNLTAMAGLARSHTARMMFVPLNDNPAEPLLVSGPVVTLKRSRAGGHPLIPAADYNAILRDVAEVTGSDLVDGGAAVDLRMTDYLDFCHFNADAHRRIAEAIAAYVRAGPRT